MRFSSLFQLTAVPPQPAVAAPVLREDESVQPARAAPALPELPDDLDARVRLVGEWQLGEG